MKKLIVTIFAGIACAAALVCIATKIQDIYFICKCLEVEDEDPKTTPIPAAKRAKHKPATTQIIYTLNP